MAGYWIDRRKKLLADEKGTVTKVDTAVTVALCFPNSYATGMSNLGFHTAYWQLNLPDDVKAERAFYECDELPLTIESGRPINDFSCVAFSIAFELDYVHVIRMLQQASIPVLRDDRTDQHPLVFAGGFVTFFNCKPLLPFVDFLFLGESEEIVSQVLEQLCVYCRDRSMPKHDLLQQLALIDGIFVPGISEDCTPRYIADINSSETVSRIITPHASFKDMFLVEIARGCYHACRFCVTGHVYEVPRVRDVAHVIASCQKGLQYTNKIGLIASAPSDYPQLDELCAFLEKEKALVSFSSLRASSVNERLLRLLIASGQRTITIAPETGSESFRKKIGKHVSDESFVRVATLAKAVGLQKVKLYMLFGLPGETQLELEETVLLVKRLAAILPVRVSMTPFVPKPMTPFANYELEDQKVLKEKIKFFRTAFRRTRTITLVFDGVKVARQQAVFAKGDETVLLPYV